MHPICSLAATTQGFLPTRGSVMLDFVFLAMFAVTLCLLVSIALAKVWRKYQWHKLIQVTLALVLVVAVVAFEIDMRFFTDWRELAKPSPYFANGWVHIALGIHLVFAIPTPFLWGLIIVQALRHFDRHPAPNEYSARHRRLAWVGVAAMLGTSITGWIFYGLAFVS